MIQTAVCESFVVDAVQALLQHEYRVALISARATGTYGPQTASYAELGGDEAAGAGYVRGGAVLTGAALVLRDGRVCLQFDPVRWMQADIYAKGALIYSPTREGRACAVLDFGGIYAAVGGDTFFLPFDCPIRL